MKEFFALLIMLNEREVYYCFQSQSGKWYNLEVKDIHGDTQYINHEDIEDMYHGLKLIWGHLLKAKMPLPKPLPLPPGV